MAAQQNDSKNDKKRNRSVNFSKLKKRDKILFKYITELPAKDLDYVNFSEYVKGLITHDMQLRAARLGIDITEIEDMRAVPEAIVSEAPQPPVKTSSKVTKEKEEVIPEDHDDDIIEESPVAEEKAPENEPQDGKDEESEDKEEEVDMRNVGFANFSWPTQD